MSMGGEGSDWARDVATDKAGNAYVAGSFSSSTATFDDSLMAYGSQLRNAGEFDIFLAKVNTRVRPAVKPSQAPGEALQWGFRL